MSDYDIQGKNKIYRGAVLPDLAVDASLHSDAVPGVNFIADHGANRAERVETLGPGPLAVFFLQVTGGDIIDAGVAEYVGTNILVSADLVTGLGQHDAEFAFMVHAVGDFRPANLPSRRQQSRWRFQEDQWLNWDIVAEFRRMLTIVAAHANDLGRPDRCK